MDRRLIAALLLAAIVATAIGVAYVAMPQPRSNGKLKVVASFYPLAYMAQAIGGINVDVTSLIPPGVEPHSYQPTVNDLVACSDADIIIYNGAGLDDWLKNSVLPSIDSSGKLIIDTTANVTLYRNVAQAEIQEHGVYDPHTWVSPFEAREQGQAIYDALVQRDPANDQSYAAGWETLASTLTGMDQSYKTQLANTTKHVIFTTHDAFGYIARHYGFQQQSIVGISADAQPSTEALVTIIQQMQQTDTYTIYLEPGYSDIYVQTVRNELQAQTGRSVQVLILYHMNGEADGLDYLGQMSTNLEYLRTGLNS